MLARCVRYHDVVAWQVPSPFTLDPATLITTPRACHCDAYTDCGRLDVDIAAKHGDDKTPSNPVPRRAGGPDACDTPCPRRRCLETLTLGPHTEMARWARRWPPTTGRT
jgi:hypothetical protein